MRSQHVPEILFDQQFADLGEHSRQIGWDIEFRQLDAGTPRARATMMGTPSCMVMRGEYNRAYHQVGQMPVDMLTIGLPDPGVDDFRWCRKVASGGQVVNFSLDSGFDGTCGAGFAGFAIALHHDLLEETCETLNLDVDFRRVLSRSEVLLHSESLASDLRKGLLVAFGSAQFSNNSETVEFFNHSGASLVLQHLAKSSAETRTATPDVRRRTVRVALEYLEDAGTLPLTVSELCSQIGVSAPTLYRAFQESLNVSPKQYIQIRRLCAVRQQLFELDNSSKIADVANGWGFWHMGQFAADYRQHFGELPSETLARATRRKQI